jgi:hypothetical protein
MKSEHIKYPDESFSFMYLKFKEEKSLLKWN